MHNRLCCPRGSQRATRLQTPMKQTSRTLYSFDRLFFDCNSEIIFIRDASIRYQYLVSVPIPGLSNLVVLVLKNHAEECCSNFIMCNTPIKYSVSLSTEMQVLTCTGGIGASLIFPISLFLHLYHLSLKFLWVSQGFLHATLVALTFPLRGYMKYKIDLKGNH